VPALAPYLHIPTTTSLTTASNSLSAPTTAPPANPTYAVAPAESVSRSDDIDALSREASDPNLIPVVSHSPNTSTRAVLLPTRKIVHTCLDASYTHYSATQPSIH
jgi:hypothetical protein